MNNNKKYPILVVDDERVVTMSLQALFQRMGHEMYTALDGEEAAKIIEKARPELIILDIRMPKVDGKELLRKIRKEYSDTKVIIITGFPKEAKEIEDIGIDGFFVKPVEIPRLVERIKYVLETKDSTLIHPTKEIEKETPKELPKAKILFIEPDINVYGYTAGLFESKEFNPGEFEVKVAYDLREAMAMFGNNSIYGYQPDIIVIYDIHRELAELDKIVDYMLTISFKPKKIIIHGIFPRSDTEIARLQKKNVIYCDQNVLTDDQFRKMNQRLIECVSRECAAAGLVKK